MGDNLLERLTDRLVENNFKLTTQRRDILSVLVKNPEKHYSAEELYEEVKRINPDVGLATIYRSLEILCSLGITHQHNFDNNYKRYELNLEGHHHHHLICLDCGRIIEFNDSVLEEFEDNLKKEYDFEIIDHRIKFYGRCKECRNS
jgi:Fur family ferric uptake transcriptional regulator